jgi:hypothetical protein
MISGRRAYVERALTLNVERLSKEGAFAPGSGASGRISWKLQSGQVASVDFEVQRATEHGCLRLDFVMVDGPGGSSRHVTQKISLTTTKMHFGGKRWWFLCPVSGERVGRLHLPLGTSYFASRHAHGLAYASQYENLYDRAERRARKLRARLGVEPDSLWLASKPKGMRWTTYARHADQIKSFERVADGRWLRVARLVP